MKKAVSTILVALMLFSVMAFSASAAGSSMSNATSISFGTTYNDSITDSAPQDFYKFTLSTSGRVNISLNAHFYCSNYYIYDSNGTLVWNDDCRFWDGTTEIMNMNENVDLTSGTYYFCVERNVGTGDYNFKLSFTSANESFKEITEGSNNSFATASTISTDKNYIGQIADNDSKDFYKFTVSTSGRVNISLNAHFYCSNYYIYDSNGTLVWNDDCRFWNGTTEEMNMNENIDLTTGTYYFCVERNVGTGNYDFKLSYTAANESFKESINVNNNSLANASSISTGTNYNGQIAHNDAKDFYKFTLSQSGKVNISLTAYFYCSNYYIYDSNGTLVWNDDCRFWNGTTEKMNMNEDIVLTKGTYYFCVERNVGTGNYNFTITAPGSSIVTQKYTLTYNANGGSNAPSSQTGGTTYTVSSAVPTRSGYDFIGWSQSSNATSASYNGGDTITLSSDTTLYAVWEAVENNDPGNTGEEPDNGENNSDKSFFDAILDFFKMIIDFIVSLFS